MKLLLRFDETCPSFLHRQLSLAEVQLLLESRDLVVLGLNYLFIVKDVEVKLAFPLLALNQFPLQGLYRCLMSLNSIP